MDIGVAFEPAVIFRLMSVEIVEDDMDLAVPMFGDDPVHEVEELEPAPPFIMPSRDFAARHVEGRKQRGGSVPLILVALARQRTPIGQFEIALAALQGLDRWLLFRTRFCGPKDRSFEREG